ncbi:MAG: MetQ/NlpA family ABC transporter substrate-binding protein [Eubacteriales bacterium]|nr:MetQ/NlpA family ABC transporter substrate-binding protein [Clostridiales bacterium]MDY5836412.1 MetQ/NlpA family ABC transporter substrate-binding protein [Eubacteriales bacterium]
MKKLVYFVSVIVLSLVLISQAACAPTTGDQKPSQTSQESTSKAVETTDQASDKAQDLVKIKVAASPQPHAEILGAVKDQLKEEGIGLEIIEFTDYVLPNIATQEGDVDANYFQHKPYLDQFNAENKTDLVSLGPVHYEPFALYPGKLKSLDNVKEGATVGIPNDVSNQARALLLLQDLGWISLPQDKDSLELTILDIAENPHKLKFSELAAAQLPRSLDDLDYAIINGNYALEAGLSVADDALAVEKEDSLAATTYANILAASKDRADDPNLAKLYQALQSETVKAFLAEKYQGAVLPVQGD